MSSRNYNLRTSPGRRAVATSSSTTSSSSYSTSTSSSYTATSNGEERTLTPAPVQRTLRLDEADDEEEDEVVEMMYAQDEDVEELEEETDSFGRANSRSYEEDDDDVQFQPGSIETPVRRPARRQSAFGELRHRVGNTAFVARLNRSRPVQQATAAAGEVWQYLLRNSFMTVNFLWLLVPLGCFLVAILVPHYLTTAIRYVDVLTTSSNGFQANLAYERGMMKSVVQEIVDVKLSAMQDEINSLRNTIVLQEREVDALRLLHDSLRQVHEESQRKMSVVDSNSILSIHIEHVVSKHTETLWKRVIEKLTQTEETLRATTTQQLELLEAVTKQQHELEDLRQSGNTVASSSKPQSIVAQKAAERELREEIYKWKRELQEDLRSTLEREVIEVEDRMHKSLLSEKQVLVDSVKMLNTLDAANPALVSMIESAVVKVEKKKVGAPDHAALANGAIVVRCERDLLSTSTRSPFDLLDGLFGLSSSSAGRFTSTSFRSTSLIQLSNWLLPQDIPWWLSRHNGRPETALSETKEIGSCWGMSGSSGRLTVKFARRIFADSITIDHIPEEIATDFASAPHDFRVFGVSTDATRGTIDSVPFGNFTYERSGTSSQTFRLTSSLAQRVAIDAATLEIASNHGHPDYTCLYRFQVHGTPAP